MNLENLSDSAGLLAVLDELAGKRDLFGRQGRGPAEPDTLRLRSRSAGAGPLMDQGPLELGDAGEHSQHHAARRRRGISPGLRKRPQTGASRLDLFGDVEKISRRSGKAIQAGHRHHVIGAQMIEHKGELRSVSFRSGDFFLINPLASRCQQRGALLVKVLVVGRDAGISDEQGQGFRRERESRNLPRAIRRGNPYSATEQISGARFLL